MVRDRIGWMLVGMLVAGCHGKGDAGAGSGSAAVATPPGSAAAAGSDGVGPAGSGPAVPGLDEIGAILDRAHTEADGRTCETEIVRAACDLAYKTRCSRAGAPELAFWYQVELPLGAIDHVEAGVGLSDHPGHAAIDVRTKAGALHVVDDTGRIEAADSVAIGLGVGPEVERDAERLRDLLVAASAACR